MPNQRAIAKRLGINQATVSLALRGDPSIPEATRRRVREAARRLGYRENSYVSTLMAHIRSGRPLSDKGVVALLVDAASEREWLRVPAYRSYHEGMVRRAAELGFRTEGFFLRSPGMSPERIDGILHSRGVRGLVLAPPYPHHHLARRVRWERYACVATGYGREAQQLDRVANDHYQNMRLVHAELLRRGYRRLGTVLPPLLVQGVGARWTSGFLQAEALLPAGQRVPLLVAEPGRKEELPAFRRWFRKWRPDALVSLIGGEAPWLEALKLAAPADIGMACVIRPPDSPLAGIEERNEALGAAALEWVASRLARNEYGPPETPRLLLFEGRWVDGTSVRTSDSS